MQERSHSPAFTLIELSIALVIIGLIVGGILVGQDLIKGAEVRAQISQIEKLNQAVNTFKAKFSALPGDMPPSTANQFGFTLGNNCNGQVASRDGNGLIDGYNVNIFVQNLGETGLFWQDISSPVAGNLIEGTYPNSGGGTIGCVAASGPFMSTSPGTTYVGDYFPQGKIGHGNFIYVYETSGYNWFGLSEVTGSSGGWYIIASGATIPVIQAYNMDKKVDDGLPLTGSVQTMYIAGAQAPPVDYPPNAATDTTTTCYNTAGPAYSISSVANYGAGGNCALSFRFQ